MYFVFSVNMITLICPTLERMNLEVVYLVAIFAVGCVAITFRSILFNLAGERFVARLRTKVHAFLIDYVSALG